MVKLRNIYSVIIRKLNRVVERMRENKKLCFIMTANNLNVNKIKLFLSEN